MTAFQRGQTHIPGHRFGVLVSGRCEPAESERIETFRNVFLTIISTVIVKAKHFLLTFVSEIKTEPSLTYLYNIKRRPL